MLLNVCTCALLRAAQRTLHLNNNTQAMWWSICSATITIQHHTLTFWNEKIGLIWQGKMCPIYNTGKCKQGSFTSTPGHSEHPLLQTSPFLVAVWLPFMVGRGHFTFIHIRKWVAIAQPRCLHIHLYIDVCHTVSVYFSQIGKKVANGGKSFQLYCSRNNFVPHSFLHFWHKWFKTDL